MPSPPFHLALPVHDLAATRDFYERVLGCTTGRTSSKWIDYDFFGHQLTTHLVSETPGARDAEHNAVDGDQVPVRHFGVVLELEAWRALVESLRASEVSFLIEPRVRFEGLPGEQHTFFVRDPSGNALEFKSFASLDRLFVAD